MPNASTVKGEPQAPTVEQARAACALALEALAAGVPDPKTATAQHAARAAGEAVAAFVRACAITTYETQRQRAQLAKNADRAAVDAALEK